MRNPFDDLVPPPRWPELGLREYLVFAGVAALLLLLAAEAWAQEKPRIDCLELAATIGATQWAREMGAKRDRVTHDVRQRNKHRGLQLADAMAREVRFSWHQGLPMQEAMQDAYNRCIQRMGEIGDEG